MCLSWKTKNNLKTLVENLYFTFYIIKLKFMKKRILLLIVLFIFLISFLTLFLIFNYLDPYRDTFISVFVLTVSFLLFSTSFATLILYIFKKISYRWEVFLWHIFSSLRQALLFSFFLIWWIIFYNLWVFSISTIWLLLVIIIFIELLFQNLH